MRAERIVLRAKYLAARKALEGMLRQVTKENQELRTQLGETQAKLADLADEARTKLIRPATMGETAKIMVTK
jgi:hypothetical protein